MHDGHLNVLLQACLRTPSRLSRIADESRILNFRRMLEKHKLASGFFAAINRSGKWMVIWYSVGAWCRNYDHARPRSFR